MSEFLAEASVLIRPDTKAFRATLVAELEAATRGIVVPVQIAAAAGARSTATANRATATAAREATVATEQLNVSKVRQATADAAAAREAVLSAEAQRAEAAATRAAAVAARESAVAHEQLARGMAATALSEFGLRGATLAASERFLIGAAAVTLLVKSLHEASNEAEALATAERVFGAQTRQVEEDVRRLADPFGISTTAGLEFEGQLGNLLETAGIAHERIPALSNDLLKLAADMAAFKNVPLESTLSAIRLALVGNSRGLRQFGVELSAAAVNAEALAESGKRTTAELTRQDRVLARVNLLFAQTANIQGSAERRSGSLAGQTRILHAELTNLSAEVGQVLVPAATRLVSGLADTVKGIQDLIGVVKDAVAPVKDLADSLHVSGTAGSVLGHVLRAELNPLGELHHLWGLIHGDHKKAADETHTLADDFAVLNGVLQQTEARVAAMLAATGRINFQRATAEVGRLQDKLLDLQFRSASPNAQIANLQAQLQEQLSIIANPPTVKAKTAAKEERNRLQQEIQSILDDQKRSAEDIAQKAQDTVAQILQIAQDARDTVQRLSDQADQAFTDMLSAEQGTQNLQTLRAERTQSLVDDVAAERALQALLVREIAAAKRTIIDEKLRAQTVLELTTALVQTNNAIHALEQQQAQNRQQRRQARFDAAAESVDLDIQLAQTNKDIRGEIAARQRRIQLDLEREKAVRGDILSTKRLRNDIAEQRAAIADLRKQLQQRNKDFQALSFEFLQTQTGFASSLISNLIPGGATAGLVGGGAITTPTLSPERSRPPDVGAGLGAAAQTSSGPRGATTGQMSVLIEVNRHILRALERLAGARQHPEAANQKVANAVSMDIINW